MTSSERKFMFPDYQPNAEGRTSRLLNEAKGATGLAENSAFKSGCYRARQLPPVLPLSLGSAHQQSLSRTRRTGGAAPAPQLPVSSSLVLGV